MKTRTRKTKPTEEQVTELRMACNGFARPGGPKKFVKFFFKRFAKLVESGKKTQTIRPVPKRIPRRGDILSLRVWNGIAYRSRQHILKEVPLYEIKVCHIHKDGIFMQPPEGSLCAIAGVKIIELKGLQADRFAHADGFENWEEMRKWFEEVHGLPFDGVVLYW
jgi:hypothetical protein